MSISISVLIKFKRYPSLYCIAKNSDNNNNNNSSLILANTMFLLVEIDRYISLPIFFPIFKHYTIIGYRFWKKTITEIIYIYFFFTYTIIQSITSSEMCSLYLTHPSAYTLGAVDTHTHTHTHTLGAVDTHTWSSGHCSLRRSSSTTTACNFFQDSLVWNTLNYIKIYYRTIISPINFSIKINYYLRKRSQFEYSSV